MPPCDLLLAPKSCKDRLQKQQNNELVFVKKHVISNFTKRVSVRMTCDTLHETIQIRKTPDTYTFQAVYLIFFEMGPGKSFRINDWS